MTDAEPAGTASSGPAVLDIGGGTGALLVVVPAALLHAEIEVSPEHRPGARTHTGVHERPIDGAPAPVALFPSLGLRDMDALGIRAVRDPPSGDRRRSGDPHRLGFDERLTLPVVSV